MPDKRLDLKGVPMVGPDGKFYDIPVEDVEAGVRQGGRVVAPMTGPDGNRYFVPVDEVEKGLTEGGHLLQHDGTPFPEGQEPQIVGHNNAGQPMWGTHPAGDSRGLIGSIWDALKGAYLSVGQMIDPRRNEYEQQLGLNKPIDYALYPFERAVEPNVQAAARAGQEFDAARQAPNAATQREHEEMGTGEELAAAIPFVGPWAAGVGERAGQQIGEGDPAGAEGTMLGNLAAAAVPGAAETGVDAYYRAGGLNLGGRLAEAQAPAADLNKPIAPGDLSPQERYEAAQRMGVNLDRAQATNATVPKMVKKLGERSAPGQGTYGENFDRNVEALHRHATALQDGVAPAMSREQFGTTARGKLEAHRASLADEPGQQAAAQTLLDSIHPKATTGEEFGAEAQHALQQHLDSMYSRAGTYLTDALARKGTTPATGKLSETADKIYAEDKDYFKEHPEALNIPGVKRVWEDWVKRYSPKAAEDAGVKPTTVSSIQNAVKLRSDMQKLYESPEIVKSRSEGWLKQMVSAMDEGITDPDNEQGMSAGEIQKFRAGNSIWKRMKSMYDDPQSPFFSIVRNPEPKTVAGTLEKLKPAAARQFREAMGDVKRNDLVQQQQRQVVSHLLDPSENGTPDLAGLSSRWEKVPKEQATELLGQPNVTALNDLASKTSQKTVYDQPGSRLAQVINAPDGLTASRAMFNDNGSLRLTPEEVRTMEQADPSLLPQLKRQAISRLFDPSGNGTADLKNFPSRWNRAQKEPLEGVLSPDQLQEMDNLASVSHAVHENVNPSGTSSVLQPAIEAGGVVSGLGTGASLAASGHPLAGAVTAAAPVAELAAQSVAARHMVDPEATRAIMEHQAPTPVGDAVRDAVADANPAQSAALASVPAAQQDPRDRFKAMTDARKAPAAEPSIPAAPSTSAQPSARFKQMTDQRRGVSTPPNGGQVTDETKSEPNEVHDDAAAQAAMKTTDSTPPTPVSPSGGVSKLQDEQGNTIYQAPEGATHEVLHPDDHSVLGHVVNGEYVALPSQ